MSFLYHTIFYTPLYNLLVLLFKIIPWADAGVVVIVLTAIVRLIIYPLSKKAIVTQARLQELNPKLNEIKEKYKDKKEEQAKETMLLYKKEGINPFSGIFVLLIQLPIIWALYRIFLYAGLPSINTALLYSFIPVPAHVSMIFLGLIDITGKSVLLAIFAAATSFIQLKISTGRQPAPAGKSFSDNLARSMQGQMKYVFPILVFFISYKISGVIALYWCATNIFTIVQEIVVRRNIKKIS